MSVGREFVTVRLQTETAFRHEPVLDPCSSLGRSLTTLDRSELKLCNENLTTYHVNDVWHRMTIETILQKICAIVSAKCNEKPSKTND